MTFASSPGIFRIVRGVALDLRSREYVAAAQTRGEPMWRILLIEILPNARGPLLVDSMLRIGYTTIQIGILAFSVLDFRRRRLTGAGWSTTRVRCF